jgi:putative nucleotidyltransferase-like protein
VTMQHWSAVAIRLLQWLGGRNGECAPSPGDIGVVEELASRRLDGLLYHALQLDTPRRRIYQKVWALQRTALAELDVALRTAGITFALFRGADYFGRWFVDEPFALINDLDILIPALSVGPVKALFLDQGYEQARYDSQRSGLVTANVSDVATFEATHNHLFPFVRAASVELAPDELQVVQFPLVLLGSSIQALIRFTVHFGVAAPHPAWSFDNGSVWSRMQPHRCGIGLALSDADSLWYVLSRNYMDVGLFRKAHLRDLGYTVPLLTRGDINWDTVVDVTQRHSLHGEMFHRLALIEHLLAGVVPRQVLGAVHPSLCADRSKTREWGWHLDTLFGLEEPVPADIDRLISRPL